MNLIYAIYLAVNSVVAGFALTLLAMYGWYIYAKSHELSKLRLAFLSITFITPSIGLAGTLSGIYPEAYVLSAYTVVTFVLLARIFERRL